MSNTIKTLADGDIVRIMLDSFHNKSVFLKTINRQHENDFAQDRHKNGGTILIKNPNEFIVGTGALIDVQPINESTQSMTVATQLNIPVTITSYERTMSLDDFQVEVADPAMKRLSAEVESYVLSYAYKYIYNYTGTPATTPASMAAITTAGARLDNYCAPDEDRYVLLDPTAMAAVTNSMLTYFHQASEIDKAFSKAYVGEAGGFKFMKSAMVPSHTNGARTDATPVTNIANWANGNTSIITTGETGGTTGALAAGDVFTVAGVYSVNPETKVATQDLMQFVVRIAMDCNGTDTIAVYPTIYISGAHQNVYASAWSGSKALVFVAAGGSGAASGRYVQDLAYHKDFLTFATAPLPLPYGDKGAMATFEDITLRMWQFSDGINDTHTTRFDILFGFLVQRPQWAVRMRG